MTKIYMNEIIVAKIKMVKIIMAKLTDALPTPWRTQMWVQMKDNRRRKSQDVLPSSQHFEGLRGVLELWDGTKKNWQAYSLTWACTQPTHSG